VNEVCALPIAFPAATAQGVSWHSVYYGTWYPVRDRHVLTKKPELPWITSERVQITNDTSDRGTYPPGSMKRTREVLCGVRRFRSLCRGLV